MKQKLSNITFSKYHFTTIICFLMLSMTTLFIPYSREYANKSPLFTNLTARSLSYNSITHLIVRGYFAVKTQERKSTNVSIITTDKAMKHLSISNNYNTLLIDNHFDRTQLNPPISVSLFLNKHLRCEIAGSGELEILIINDESVFIKLNGYIKGKIRGIYPEAQLYLYNAVDLNARDFHVQNLQLSLTGASTTEVYVNNLIDIFETGYGDIKYYGQPRNDNIRVVNMNSILPDKDYE